MATIAIGISPKAGGGATTQVPVDALAEDGVPPEEGDSVSFSVEGKVESVSGDTATVSIDSINGEPIGAESSEGSEDEEAQGAQGAQGAQAAGGGGGSQPPEGPSGASPGSPLERAMSPMGSAPAAAPGMGLARNRLDRKGTNLMRQRLMKGARGQPLPF